ncbi:hypothetical protein ACFQ1R_15835 [Mariniflexile jejuense]|uniref:MORN repeat protein n=1 Tax=Mariniflexile jejuense TaxID=1173582 RepID=A0ABW3JMB6_9FLAO
MKRNFTIIFLVLISTLCNSQHSERFLELVKDLEQITCKTDTTYYKNGNVWWTTCWTTYEYNSEKYSTRTGKMVQYYKSGQIANEYSLDNYGNIKSRKNFDRKGNKTLESVTIEIDSNAKSMDEFFDSQNHMTFKTYTAIYRCSKKLGTYYLYKEGQWINGKKNGVWTTYDDNEEVKKEKEY